MKTLDSLVFAVTVLCFANFASAQDHHADEAYEGTPGDTLFDTVDVQGGINENTRPMASKSIEILTAHARSPGISSRPVEPIGQTLAYQCPVCGRLFRHPSLLMEHQISHTGRRDLKCKICSSDYKDSSSLAEHMRQNHVDQSLPPKKSSKSQGYASEQTEHPCPKCGRHFKCWTGLKSHQRSVHPEGVRHVCEKCGLSFARELYLKRHIIQVHESEAKHTCPHCGKSVTRSWNLLKHIRNVHGRDLADEKSAVDTVFEISRYTYICNVLLSNLMSSTLQIYVYRDISNIVATEI
ncbi:hypothetical protein T265_08351 [Opisthorchis viverrini]|uniref:C2H2-type domain-containing protein n=1 Tax=Opisthorchis viverrini TaxID=6198 RepID=A0A075A8M6_OPIVI|nr:hypothetical protein T265_08351 [Opisthorchis viverrini]KER23844.1 hypothetical protein T265_08351 [Opisthorchis viverrini]